MRSGRRPSAKPLPRLEIIADALGGDVRAERYRGKAERWRKIVFEAVKQSGRSVIPIVEEPAPFFDVVSREGQKILFDADAEPTTWRPETPATLFIGPEGGWTDREIQTENPATKDKAAMTASCMRRRG